MIRGEEDRSQELYALIRETFPLLHVLIEQDQSILTTLVNLIRSNVPGFANMISQEELELDNVMEEEIQPASDEGTIYF